MKRIVFLILIGLLLVSPVLAVEYPVINGIDINRSDVSASDFILYLLYLITAIGSLVAVILLVTAGLEWVSAYGDAKAINSAKKKVAAVFAGLIVLLSSYIILNTINPQLLNINIDDISNQDVQTEPAIPEGSGVILYSDVNYEGEKLVVKSSKTNTIDDHFYKKAASIKINQPQDFNLGAIIFGDMEVDGKKIPGAEFKGQCSYVTGDIPDLDVASGDQNNPPIGQDNLASLIVFRGDIGGASITIYNNYNCQPKTTDYCRVVEEGSNWKDPFPCPPEEEGSCSFSVNKFTNIKEIIEKECTTEEASFKGDILSIKVDKRTGVLLRGLLVQGDEENPQKICQYIDSKNSNCINMIKYGPFYKTVDGQRRSIFAPEEIMLFSLH